MLATVLHRPDPPALKKLLEAVANGDRQAFATLVYSYKHVVTETAEHVLGKGELATGSARETFLHVYRLLAAGARPETFLPWLVRVTKNDALALVGKYNDKHNDDGKSIHIDDLRIEPDPDDEFALKNKNDVEARAEGDERNKNTENNYPQENSGHATDIPEGSFYVPYYDDEEPEPPGRTKKTSLIISLIIICVLIILFLWILIGILRVNKVFNVPDLGYEWFNDTLFTLF